MLKVPKQPLVQELLKRKLSKDMPKMKRFGTQAKVKPSLRGLLPTTHLPTV